MGKLRPIVREPRSSSERMEAQRFAQVERSKPLAPSVHPGQLFTSEGAGVQIKRPLGGGVFSPLNNTKQQS